VSVPGPSDWTSSRRAATWANVAVQAVLLLALLVVANLIARKSPKRFDMTSRRSFALSNLSEDTLRNLTNDIEIWINPSLYQMGSDKSLTVAVQRTEDLLEEIGKRTPKITVRRLNAEDRADFARFRQHWTVMSPAALYLLATRGSGMTNKKVIEIQQMYDGNPVTGEVTSFRGEPALIGAIRDLVGGAKHVVYESEGHSEFVSGDKSSMAMLKHFLTTNEGVEIKRVALIDVKRVPDECEVLMILGPAQPFQEHELQVLRDYIERGGSLLVAVRPRVRTGLEKMLAEYSVVVGDNLVFDPQQYKPPSQTYLVVRDFNMHDVNRNMVNLNFLMPDACTIDPVERKDSNWKITPLAMAGPNSWEETGETGPGVRPKRDGEERGGNMKLIVAVEKKVKSPLTPRHEKAKIDVWGSVTPFTDGVLYANGRPQELQIQYVINHFRWLMDRPLMDIEQSNIPVRPLQLDEGQLSRLFWIVVIGFPGFGVSLGLLAWFVRRK